MKKQRNTTIYNFNPTHIVIICFTLFIAIGLLVGEIYREKDYQLHINAQFVEVDAQIVEFKEFKNDGMHYYATYFEYTSPDGKKYSGFWDNDIYSEEEAQAMLGTKVLIYYSNDLGIRKTVDGVNAAKNVEKPNHTAGGIIVAALLLLAVNSIIKTVRFIMIKKRYEAQQKEMGYR